MKKILLLSTIVLLFITCKKDKKVTPVLEVTGTWTLYSYQSNLVGNIDVNSGQYPCLSDNILRINSDFTTNTAYTGTDTCYITPLRNRGTSFGFPGQAPNSGVWRRSGNDIYFGKEHAIISNASGKLFLTIIDTLTVGFTSPVIIKTVDVKE